MDTTSRHYEELLAEHYVWMNGGSLAAKIDEQRALLEALGVLDGATRLAIDLGSGPGFQSLALANLGFCRVLAIDTSRRLLDELIAAKGTRQIESVCADLRHFARFALPESADTIVCMGDTLTHLLTFQDVDALVRDAYEVLGPGGRLILTFRDFSTDLIGLDRFIPVRADSDRIMICALDYAPERVTVTDLIHIREGENWSLKKSSYQKLRLAPAVVAQHLQNIGFQVDRNEPMGRMHAITARKSIAF